jgi:hypothetical protein
MGTKPPQPHGGDFAVDSDSALQQQDTTVLVQGGYALEHNDLAVHSG